LNFSLYIAKRYLVSKKKTNLINIISAISVIGLAIGTMGLVIGLSGFNGFDNLIKTLFSSFDPDLKITAVQGKYFSADVPALKKILKMPEVAVFSESIEDNALLRYEDHEVLATVKGVNEDFKMMSGVDTMLIAGNFKLQENDINYAILGQNLAYYLSIGLKSQEPVAIYVPKKSRNLALTPEGNFNQGMVYPAGVFQIQQDLDNKYIIVPIAFAREIFEADNKVTAVELKLKEGVNVKDTQQKIASVVGDDFTVKNRYQQHDYLFKTMQGEKFVTYLILILILIIASFNIIGSLTMLIIDKKEDIDILRSMGAGNRLIRNIFLFEGWFISILGSIIGCIAGVILCKLQIVYGFVKLQGGGSFMVDAYPVKIIPTDIVLILISVMLIGFLASWFPVKFISSNLLREDLH
jgi:lipoprotein-releasing system permease protein